MEITYSRFEKTLEFPDAIDGASIEHNFDNGLLIIRLWKEEKSKTANAEGTSE
jgi:HSP20 family molecular chaperone IbpA